MSDDRTLPPQDDLPDDIHAVLAFPEVWEEPPAELHDAIWQEIHRQQTAAALDSPIIAADTTAAPDSDRDATVTRMTPGQRRGPRSHATQGRPWLLGLAAAATLVVAAAAGAVVAHSWPGGSTTPEAVVALQSTDLAPGASGQAEITDKPSGFQVVLDLDGLEPAPPGTYYQAWLKSAAGDLVTIGTFHGRGGTGDIILWSGVDPTDYPTLTVTLQDEGSGAESSGQVVLSGSLP